MTSMVARPRGVISLVASEAISALIGLCVLIHLGRSLGPRGFARLEFASLVAGLFLVLVRGGIDSIALRECSRNPRQIGRWTGSLLWARVAIAMLLCVVIAIGSSAICPESLATNVSAGLLLLPSSLLLDVGLRATGRLHTVAISQVIRAVGLAFAAVCFVRSSHDLIYAALCATLAEACAVAFLAVCHVRIFGMPHLQWRRNRVVCLVRRGSVASLSRLGRVALFAADMLVLGMVGATADLGGYAASRRVVFAMVALGLIVPAALAPAMARAWRERVSQAQRVVSECARRVLHLAVPATIGLMLTSSDWMALLFGDAYQNAGLCLMIVAARVPFLMLAAVEQTALIAVRREGDAWRLIALACGLAAILIPWASLAWGAYGAGMALLGVEVFLAVGGWFRLRRLQIAPRCDRGDLPVAVGCLVMIAVVTSVTGPPVWVASLLGASAFGLTIGAFRGRMAILEFGRQASVRRTIAP